MCFVVIVDHLPDPLVEIESGRVAVARLRAAEVGLARHHDRWTRGRGAARRTELVATCLLHAEFIQRAAADGGRDLR